MKGAFGLALLLASICAPAVALDSQISATGMLYFRFDMTSQAQVDGVISARFVPDAKSRGLFPAVKSGPYASPVKYISFEPAEAALEQAVGQAEANRLSHGDASEMQVPVELKIRNFRTDIECDSRVYYADLVSVKLLKDTNVANTAGVPAGC